jgi:hypothetical protein
MRRFGLLSAAMVLVGVTVASVAHASTVTITGTVSYNGAYSGDTLYVAALDTTQGQDVVFLDLKAYPVGSPPLSQPYSISFDNASAPPEVIVAALLDVDGGGVDSVSGGDILGWYDGHQEPLGVSSSTSHTGVNFALPQAEIEGTLTLAPGQSWANIVVATDCAGGTFTRPSLQLTSSGAYFIRGIYAGSWCVFAFGFIPPFTFAQVCYGDPTCANPSFVALTAAQKKTGIDLDFTANVPVRNKSTWGSLKAKY